MDYGAKDSGHRIGRKSLVGGLRTKPGFVTVLRAVVACGGHDG
jgi:hypothetical protein